MNANSHVFKRYIKTKLKNYIHNHSQKMFFFLSMMLTSGRLHAEDYESDLKSKWNAHITNQGFPDDTGSTGKISSKIELRPNSYVKQGIFHDFQGCAIFLPSGSATYALISECSFTKVNPNDDRNQPAVINFKRSVRVLLYRCCTRECEKNGKQDGIFIYCDNSANILYLDYCTISKCTGKEASSMVYFQTRQNLKMIFANVNFSQNHAKDTPVLNIVYSYKSTLSYCTFENNEATGNILYDNGKYTKYHYVIFKKNKALNIIRANDTPTVDALYFLNNEGTKYKGQFDNKIIENTEYYPTVLSTFGCLDRNYKEPVPERTPSSTPMTTPLTTPSTTPSSSPQATPSTTPSSTPEKTPSSTPSITPSSTPEKTPSHTPQMTINDITPMPFVYHLTRKHYLIGNDA